MRPGSKAAGEAQVQSRYNMRKKEDIRRFRMLCTNISVVWYGAQKHCREGHISHEGQVKKRLLHAIFVNFPADMYSTDTFQIRSVRYLEQTPTGWFVSYTNTSPEPVGALLGTSTNRWVRAV
jgi:hypothetical protein